MRLRNIPQANTIINDSPYYIKSPVEQKGKWHSLFANENPIRIEIGMGKGQFLLNMAKKYPQLNFIGIERYASVLVRAIQRIELEEYQQLKNVRFICMDAGHISEVFSPGEVERIYLNFSDPWPKAKHSRRRLTAKKFLQQYQEILPPQGQLEMKTDNTPLFDFSLTELRSQKWSIAKFTYDLHHHDRMNVDNIMTEYEERFSSRGQPINKLIAKNPRIK